MDIAYIEQENVILHRNSEHLVITKYGKKLDHIPLTNVHTIVVLNSCQITSPALELIFEKNIDIIYMSKSGKIKNRMLSASGGGAIIRLAQHQAFLSKERKNGIAREIVCSKINNQKKLIGKYKKYYSIQKYQEIINKMTIYCNKVQLSQETDEIMGFEGISAKLFWTCYKELLINQAFTKRDYRPAPDYINSALNLGYAFLSNEISICLVAEKFDLEIGFLHSILYGRNSLTLDIMEEFRTPFIDAWLLKIFNLNILSEKDFDTKENGFYLNKEGFQKFIDVYHKHTEKNHWKEKFKNQSSKLKNALIHNTKYEAFIWE